MLCRPGRNYFLFVPPLLATGVICQRKKIQRNEKKKKFSHTVWRSKQSSSIFFLYIWIFFAYTMGHLWNNPKTSTWTHFRMNCVTNGRALSADRKMTGQPVASGWQVWSQQRQKRRRVFCAFAPSWRASHSRFHQPDMSCLGASGWASTAAAAQPLAELQAGAAAISQIKCPPISLRCLGTFGKKLGEVMCVKEPAST